MGATGDGTILGGVSPQNLDATGIGEVLVCRNEATGEGEILAGAPPKKGETGIRPSPHAAAHFEYPA